MELGRLPDLIARAGSAGGSVTIRPIVEEVTHLLSAPIDGTPERVGRLAGWEITCRTPTGDLTTGGRSITAAVTKALQNRDAWPDALPGPSSASVPPLNIPRLALLVDQIFTELSIRPLEEDRRADAGRVAGWEIGCETFDGRFAVAGPTVDEAVKAALVKVGAWE